MRISFRVISLLTPLLAAATSHADTIILKDGTFVEGEITLQTSRTVRVSTRFGERTYRRSNIEEIIESVNSLDPDAVNKFAELSAPVKAVLNARAEYDLGRHDPRRYERALARLEPFRDYEDSRAIRIHIDWLIIEINERLGRWETVRQLLENKRSNGTPQERMRAKAHLDLFDANPDYDLRYVGEKHARNFIKGEELRNRARQPDALRDYDIMRIALEETCEQLLVEDQLSVKALADKLDPEATYEACKTLPRIGDVGKYLPYIEDLKRAEATLAKAQAILDDYGGAFELDIVRTEVNHLLPILDRLQEEASAASPETYNPPFDRRTGRLTKDGREQWRQRCDEFLTTAEPVTRLIDYMVDRVNHYPQALRDLRKMLLDSRERFKETVRAVRKARSRTHV
ncbi:MAG: hypothetical protein JSU86_03320 [Phycisphaerales bacterium]|nr:MAG: hypothetical protein JSU86_03320 [Phycisphaerales bacterium]